jgi:hypothetical protein
MSLPRPPISANTPIPNQPFSSEEVYYLEGNQGRLPLGNGLYIDPATGDFTDIAPSPYIYCVPQYSNLPVTYPPYGCETEVNTTGVTNFTDAWRGCTFTEMPCVDASAVTDFFYAWGECRYLSQLPSLDTSSGKYFLYSWTYTALTSFPQLNLSNGLDFRCTWSGCYYLTSFPSIDFSSGRDFEGTWYSCTDLVDFPEVNVNSGEYFYYTWQSCTSLVSFPFLNVSSGTYFGFAWSDCTSLTSFPAGMFDNCSTSDNQAFRFAWKNCALNQTSVNNILVSLDTSGIVNNFVNLDGGTSAAPNGAGAAAKISLQGKGWTVVTN